MIPLGFITRYAVPLIVAAIYLGDVNIPEQMAIFDKTMRYTDETLFKANKEGDRNETFDFIIVGGGAAGAVLANRLTASGEHTVLLLEAGGDLNPFMEIPYTQRFYWGGNIMDWGYKTVKQNRSCESSGGICIWPRGQVLGGSSSVNGLLYNRCLPKDFDSWANFTGGDSWSWENLLDTYNSIEDYHGFYADTANGTHGSGGEMYVGKIDYIPGVEIFEEALREKGIPVRDLNRGDASYGFSKVDYNIKDGLRWGTYQAFLEPILNRTNLVIYRYAYAVKIETTSGENGNLRATGVTYQRHGATITAWARKEVVVSGGVVESPKLLMLSGIGPKEHLEELGIEVVLDLPAVGEHLQEHIGYQVTGDDGGFLVNTTFSIDHNTTDAVLEFLQNGTGPLNGFSYDNGYAAQLMSGYVHSKNNQDMEWPDIHTYAYSQYFAGNDRQEFYFLVEIGRTTTTGSIKLASKNPEEKPLIDPNFFEDPTDIERLVDGVEILMDIFFNTTVFQKYGIQPMGKYAACDHLDQSTREFWRCYSKDKANSGLHPTSTCRMGPDRTVAVVDSKLKVFGTENLRVIDASSIPFVPTGNTNMPSMLVGARGAEIILAEVAQ